MALSVMSKTNTCPSCQAVFSDRELVVEGPPLKNDRKWYGPSHENGKLSCPKCHATLKLDKKSMWPVLLILPASLTWLLIPGAYSWLVFSFLVLGVLYVLKQTIRYVANDR
jgi:ribosomal protein S27AE